MDLEGINTILLSLLGFFHVGHKVLVLRWQWKVPSKIYTVVFWPILKLMTINHNYKIS